MVIRLAALQRFTISVTGLMGSASFSSLTALRSAAAAGVEPSPSAPSVGKTMPGLSSSLTCLSRCTSCENKKCEHRKNYQHAEFAKSRASGRPEKRV